MPQTRLNFTLPRKAAEEAYRLIEARFEDDGYPLAILEKDEKAALFEVSLYVEDAIDAIATVVAELVRPIAADVAVERELLPDIDWVAHTLKDLTPVRAGRFLVHGSHNRGTARGGEIAIEIEAGLAFGTGHHGTTAGCLEMIGEVVRRERPANVLDVGTGSAVLAIAIARLARIAVLATDIDPVATRVAERNIRLNHAHGLVRAVTATGFVHREIAARAPYDLIVANILARPLMRLAPDMARHIAPGGSIVLSGILDEQRDAVVAAYVGQRFRHVKTTHREGWVTLHLKR